ncbi:MAG: hypothetical protein R3A44_00185 [Caldilineaceae bacterium]
MLLILPGMLLFPSAAGTAAVTHAADSLSERAKPALQTNVNCTIHTRVLVDYFFPGLLSPAAIRIPDTLIANWSDVTNNAVARSFGHPDLILYTYAIWLWMKTADWLLLKRRGQIAIFIFTT